MDASTRPAQKRHRSAAPIAAALVAILLTATPACLASTTEHAPTPTPDTQIDTASSAHDISITTVKFGNEGLELSARFTEQSQEPVADVAWTIRNTTGEKVFDGITSVADATLPPGDYRVTARYGAAQILQGVTLHEGTKLSVNFILNAGGLRILPRVKGLGAQTLPSLTKVFALSGPLHGQLITSSHTPGEVLKVSAGEYRIESRFENGNAVAVTDVKVKPGVMSAVNIDHVAGLAQLSYRDALGQDMRWTITDETGIRLLEFGQLTTSLVLKPGHYRASTTGVTEKPSIDFEIRTGEIQSLVLGAP